MQEFWIQHQIPDFCCVGCENWGSSVESETEVIVIIRRATEWSEGGMGHLHLRMTFLIHLRKDLRFGFRYLELVSGHH